MITARLMIVEDDRVVAMDIERQLTRIGHAVVAMTSNGEEVLELAVESQPDVVLMDIRLEGAVDGVEAARQLRERVNIPVIFLTAYADDHTVERASLTQPYGYLLKPFEDVQLRTVIEMALYKHTADHALRASEHRFVTTLASIADGVIATDEKSLVTFLNPAAQALTGWTSAEATGQPLSAILRLVNEQTRVAIEDPSLMVLRLGAVARIEPRTILLSRGDLELPITGSGSSIVDDRGCAIGTVVVFRDMSEQRKLELTMRRTQADLLEATQLASMNEVAATIADEINQPLAAIVTNAEASLLWLSQDPPKLERFRESVTRIARDAHQAGEAIRSIRGLIRKPTPRLVELDIKMLMRDILELVDGDLQRSNIQLETRFAADKHVVNGDRIQLQQVVIQLMMTGMDSMTKSGMSNQRGTLRVSTEIVGRHVVVFVGDGDGDGGGGGGGGGGEHSKSTASKILIAPPLFHNHTDRGIRLSICRTILEAHGGEIWTVSKEPHGSMFKFSLPLLDI